MENVSFEECHRGTFVKLEDPSIAYGGTDSALALSETGMSIRNGEFVATMGPSDCGKSSLQKLVSGPHPAQKGCVTVVGLPLIFAGLVVIAAMGVILYEFFAYRERRVTFWATPENGMAS